jgi:hypothetical protein
MKRTSCGAGPHTQAKRRGSGAAWGARGMLRQRPRSNSDRGGLLRGLRGVPPGCDRSVNLVLAELTDSAAARPGHRAALVAGAEIALIVGLLFLYAGTPPPDVNEAHYLPKAKHYWDPTWCATDGFLTSADAHPVFYASFGWLTRFASLSMVAWLGRLVTWIAFAVAWRRLSRVMFPQPYLSVLTAALFVMLSDLGHLSGEWAVGGFEAKGIAYVLVLCGLRALMLGRWNRVWPWFGAAAAFHVLVGGWSVVAAAIAWSLWGPGRPTLLRMLPSLAGGLVLALPGLVPALRLAAGADAATIARANEIYVYLRLAHHLVWYRFAPERWLAFGALLVAWGVLGWYVRQAAGPWPRLNRFVVGSLAISGVGMLISLTLWPWPAASAGLLKFYWFRLADVAVPLALSLGIPWAIREGADKRLGKFTARSRTTLAWSLVVLAPLGWFSFRFATQHRDFRPRAVVQSQGVSRGDYARARRQYLAWRDVCDWIDRHTDPGDRFLTPRGQQTFKWYAGRAEVASWKDVPQDPRSVVRWWHLIEAIYPPAVQEAGLGAWSDEQLRELAREHEVDYILVDRRRTGRRLRLQRVYPEPGHAHVFYELYRVLPAAD